MKLSRDQLFATHPLPWSVHPDYPRPGFASDDAGVVMDATGEVVLASSEWFSAEAGVVEALVDFVNAKDVR